ncbi:MAG: LSm14 family protein [Candidatus Bathyarchaeota archaeon]|nr:LSm14 family protein [Candidatus Termiticorpusculum sp.]MCL1971085.1 LSm14 family protein [Candidatus Termiticorpusculum sp.]
MPAQNLPPSVFQMLERNVGKKVRVIMDSTYGFEGTLEAVTQDPATISLSEVDAIVLRSTLAQPTPQIASREETNDLLYLNLKTVQRIEVLQRPQSKQ